MTPLRLHILNLLGEKHLLSAMQILESLEQEDRDVNKTSVYRSIEYLLSEGKICQHQFDQTEAVYELREHHHDHLVCSGCGKMIQVECVVRLPSTLKNFEVDHHHLTLYGRCEACQANSTPTNSING